MPLDLSYVRQQFPSLSRPIIFFDNPGGTQIVQHSLARIHRYLLECNANHEGAFTTSRQSDAILDEAHAAMADFLNAARPEEIIFGANMTSLTLHISRSLSLDWKAGDEIVVTRLDHDANITPWTLLAEERGCRVTWVDFDVEDCTLNIEAYKEALSNKTRLVAYGYASNAIGTINPVRMLTQLAHEVGALVFIDAVQYAPHGPIDVQDIGCDFLACSAYKFFGPHVGILYGRYDLLSALKAYKVRPASSEPPGKFETGTQNHEGIAGVLGVIEYLEQLGRTCGADQELGLQDLDASERRLNLVKAMRAIRAYEYELSRALLDELQKVPGLRIYGISNVRQLEDRVPTFAFRLDGFHPRQTADWLGQHSINVWDGNYYAQAVTERLGLEESGGMVRIGAVHYNTLDEIMQFGKTLAGILEK